MSSGILYFHQLNCQQQIKNFTIFRRFWTAEELVSAYSNNNKGSRSNVNKHELVNGDSSFSIFNQIQGYPAPPPL